MKCVEIENFLDDFASDELDFATRQKIERHLRECPFCRNDAENLQTTNLLLKKLPPVTPSNQFDTRIMQAFVAHQQKNSKTSFWTGIFANFSISKPTFAFGLLALIGVSILAFAFGRITSPHPEIATFENSNQTKPVENNSPAQIVEKRIEVPVIKVVEVPIYKERIVNRVVYKDREIIKTIKVKEKTNYELRENNFNLQNTAINFVQNESENFTPINLKNFQPVAEIKMNIIKQGKDNEK